MTLDPDTLALLRESARDRGVSFKEALNDAVRSGLAPGRARPYRLRPADLGAPVVPVTRALQLAAELEDEELVRRLETGR